MGIPLILGKNSKITIQYTYYFWLHMFQSDKHRMVGCFFPDKDHAFNHLNIIFYLQICQSLLNTFPQQSFDPVANNCFFTGSFADYNSATYYQGFPSVGMFFGINCTPGYESQCVLFVQFYTVSVNEGKIVFSFERYELISNHIDSVYYPKAPRSLPGLVLVRLLAFIADSKFEPAFCPAGCKYFPAVFRSHSFAKAVLVQSFSAARLICPFHFIPYYLLNTIFYFFQIKELQIQNFFWYYHKNIYNLVKNKLNMFHFYRLKKKF